MTDTEIEALVVKCGGRWDGSVWKFEDADLHPFVRIIEAEERARCAMECWYLVQKYLNDPDDDGVEHWLREAENAIRARGPND